MSLFYISFHTKDGSDKIYYSLLPGNFPSTNKPQTFTINPDTGVIKTSRLLDYEKLRKYDLVVRAKDDRGMTSNVKVYIEVYDVNDNSPIFMTNYEYGKVAENKIPGQIVEQVFFIPLIFRSFQLFTIKR